MHWTDTHLQIESSMQAFTSLLPAKSGCALLLAACPTDLKGAHRCFRLDTDELGTHLGLAALFGEASFCMMSQLVCQRWICSDGYPKMPAMYAAVQSTAATRKQICEAMGIPGQGCSFEPTQQLNDVTQPARSHTPVSTIYPILSCESPTRAQ